MAKEIDLEALKAIAVALIDSAARALRSDRIRLDDDQDFYWEVPLELQHSIKSGPPPTLDVGRLSDDWDFIKGLTSDPEDATPLSLLHLAPILNHLALRVTQHK